MKKNIIEKNKQHAKQLLTPTDDLTLPIILLLLLYASTSSNIDTS